MTEIVGIVDQDGTDSTDTQIDGCARIGMEHFITLIKNLTTAPQVEEVAHAIWGLLACHLLAKGYWTPAELVGNAQSIGNEWCHSDAPGEARIDD